MASPGEVATAVSITTLAASHLFLGTLGFATFRAQLPASVYFSIACVGMAWTTFWTGIRPLLVDAHPWVLFISPVLSSFAAPAFMLFVWNAVGPRRPPSPRWLLLGVPGVAFTLIGTFDDEVQAFLVHFARHEGPTWHWAVSPLYLAHGTQMLVCVAWMGVLLTRGLRRAPPGRVRRSLWWLVAALACAGVSMFVYTWMPGLFSSDLALVWAPWTTLPFLALTWRALRLQWEEARSAYVLRGEAERLRAASVAHAVNALAAEVGRVVARAESEATLLTHDASDTGDARASRVTERIRDAVEVTQRLMRLSTAVAQPLSAVDLTSALLKAARGAERDAGVRIHTALTGDARGLVAFAEPEAIAAGLGTLLGEVSRRLGVDHLRLDAQVDRPGLIAAEALGEALDGLDTVTVRVTAPRTSASDRRAEALVAELAEGWSGRPGGAARSAAAELRAGGVTFHGVSAPDALTLALWLKAAPPPPVERPSEAIERVPLGPDEPRLLLIGADPEVIEPVRLMLRARGLDVSVFGTAGDAWAWVMRHDAQTLWVSLIALSGVSPNAQMAVYGLRRACPKARVLAIADDATLRRLARSVDGLPIEVVQGDTPLNEVAAWLARALG